MSSVQCNNVLSLLLSDLNFTTLAHINNGHAAKFYQKFLQLCLVEPACDVIIDDAPDLLIVSLDGVFQCFAIKDDHVLLHNGDRHCQTKPSQTMW